MTQLSSKKLSTINADVALLFGKLQPNTPKEYYHVKLNTIFQRHLPGHPEITTDEVEKPVTLKLANSKNLPPITDDLQANINCLRNTLNDDYPLLPPEFVSEDLITVLLEEVNSIPANTLVLQRTTNMATLYFVLRNINLDGEKNLNLQTVEPRNTALTLTKGHATLLGGSGKDSFATSTGGKLASSIASTVGGALAKGVIGLMFPEGVPVYFDDIYKHIAKIVGQEIQQSKIDSISGAINNIVSKINNEYTPALKNKDLNKEDDRKFLYNLLQKYDQTFLSGADGMLGTLQQKEYANAGFTVFILGASLQLALIQELANVDPVNGSEETGWKSPLESSYGKPKTGTLAKTAKDFVTFANQTYLSVLEARRKSIIAEKYDEVINETPFGSRFPVMKRHFNVRINDNGVATKIISEIGVDDKKGNNPKYDAFVANELENYRKQKNDELIREMNNPLNIIADWERLITTPIKLK